MLEIGCGTGQVAAALADREGCAVAGLDASPEMLAVARQRLRDARLGLAEKLPFEDASFERAVMRLSVHLVDRPGAFAEARRVLVPEGRLAIATFEPSHFDEYWLNGFFPSLAAIDRERFPTSAQLEEELAAAGFSVRFATLVQRGSLSREEGLRRMRGRHISTLALLGEAEYRAGLARAERDLPERIHYRLDWLIAVAH